MGDVDMDGLMSTDDTEYAMPIDKVHGTVRGAV